MNKFLKFLGYWTLCFSVIFVSILISCEVGLGESVDTQPPTLSITTPFANTVIREQFKMTGTCNDEQGVASVSTVLKNTSTKEVFPSEGKSFPGTISENGKSWELIINPLSDDKLLQVPDGTYEATVTVTDKAGKTASATRSFVIDNTAPLLVITRPSSKIDEASASASIDTYGQEFNITGQVADDNDISKLVVRVFDVDGNEKSVVTLNNVPPTIDLTVAKYGEKEYEQIYGEGEGTKQFLCEVEIFDAAVHEPAIDGDQGNSRKIYYLYNDIYADVLKKYKVTEVYHMLNGSFKTDRGEEATKAEVEKILDILGKSEKQAKKGTFSLNPANNPVYSISGYDFVTGSDTEKYQSLIDNNKLLSGSAMTVKLSSGLDKAPLDKDSLGVYIVPYVYDPVEGKAEISSDEGKKIWLIKPLTDKYGKGYPIASTAEELAARESILAVGSYDYTATIEMAMDKGLSTGSAYSVGAVGHDENDVSFVDYGKCGFYYESSGSAPRLIVLNPDASTIYLGKAQNPLTDVAVNVDGTITAENQAVITVSVKDTEGGVKKVTEVSHLSSEHPNAEPWGPLAVPAKYFNQDKSENYTVVVTATVGSRVAEKEFTVYYDVAGPVIESPAITPVVSANGREDNINGTVKVQVRISDDFSRVDTNSDKKPKLEVFGSDYAYVYSSTFMSSNIVDSVDTKLFTDKQLLTFRITAYDVAGNKSVLEKKLYLDQDTDRPVVELTNASYKEVDGAGHVLDYTTGYPDAGSKNVFMAGAPVTATISDDDSIATVVVTTYRDDGTTAISSKEYSAALGTINSNPWPLSYAVPTGLGTYKVGIVVTDVEGNQNNTSEFYLIVDAGAPSINISAGSSGHYFGKQSGPIEVNGTVSGLGGLTVYQVYNELDPSKNKLITEAQPESSARQSTWKDMFKVSGTAVESDAGATSIYTVVDKKGRTGTATLTYYVDNTPPVVNIITTLDNGMIESSSQKFQGTAEDSLGTVNSGISSLYYQIVPKGSAVPVVPGVEADAESKGWIFLNGSNSWNFYKSFVNKGVVEEGSLQEGAYDLYICAYDVAQNGSAAKKLSFIVDLNTPEVATSFTSNGTDFTDIIDAKAVAVQSEYTFAFELSDTYGLAASPYTIKISKDGVVLGAADYTVTKSGAKYLVKVLQDAGKAGRGDGTFVYEITAKDLNNKATSISRTVIRDTEAPSLEVSYPEDDDWLSKNSVKITGTAEDSSGIAAVYYSSTTSVTPAVGTTALTGTNWTGSGWSLVNGTASWNITAENLSEGSVPYYFAAVDKYGNVSPVLTHNINYDAAVPAISGTTYTVKDGSPLEIRNNGSVVVNKDFTLKGTVTDSYKVKRIVIMAGKNGQAQTEKYNSGDISSQNKKSVEFSQTFTTSQLSDGIWKIEVIAYDGGNREVSADFTFEVDTQAPVVNGVPSLCSNLTPVNGWYNQSRGLVSVKATDSGSGIASLTYMVSDAVIAEANLPAQIYDNTLNGAGGEYTRTHAFVNGKNYVYVKLEDVAGNVSYYGAGGIFNCQVDITNPTAEFLHPLGGAQINDKEDLTVRVLVKDEESGFTGTSKAVITLSGENYQTGNIPASGGEVSVVIPQAKLEGKDSPSFKVTVQDKAGNSYEKTISVTIDRDPPTVKINSPVAAKINGNVTVSGISTDNVGVESLEVYRTKLSGDSSQATDITVAAGEWAGTYRLIEKFTGAAVYNWQTSYDSLGAADGTAIKFYVVAKDAAGNVGVNGKATEIDQDADRPVITFSNITLNGMTSALPRLHQETELRGIIADDDGIKSFKIAEQAASIDWDAVPEIYDNGSWSYAINSGDKTLVFRVVDQNDGIFISNASDITTSPKLIDKNGNSFGQKSDAVKDTRIYLYVDLYSPVISAKVNGTEPASYYTSPYTYTFDVSDDYKLSSVIFKIMKDGDELASGANGYSINYTTNTANHKAGSIEITGTFAGDGIYSYDITAEDKAGSRVKNSYTIAFDTTPPVLNITAPDVSEWQSKSDVTIYGTAEDLVGGVDKVYYKNGLATADGNWSTWTALSGKSAWNLACKSLAQGSTSYSFAAVDKYGNYSEAVQFNVKVDTASPKIEGVTWKKEGGVVVTVKDNGSFTTNKDFTLAGNVSDTNSIESLKLSAVHEDGTEKVFFETTGINSTTKAWSQKCYSDSAYSAENNYLKDGKWTFTLAVTDIAEKTTTHSFVADVDTVAPSIVSVVQDWSAYGKAPSANMYYAYSTPVLKVVTNDNGGSGVAGVYCYSTQEHLTTEAAKRAAGIDFTMASTGVADNYSRKLSLNNGTNYAYIRVVDEAGNETIKADDVILLVDTEGPQIEFITPSASGRLSTNIPMNFEIAAVDGLSGVKEGTEATVKLGSNTVVVSTNADGKIIGSFTAEQMSALTGSSATLSVTVKDDSGNQNANGSLTLTFDNELPSVSIVNPARSEVNGNITITGTASDNVGLNNVKLYFKVDSGEYTLLNTFEGTDGYNWKYSGGDPLSNYFSTTAYDGKSITFKAVAEDVAQNVRIVEKTVTVDQDSDRPEIVITNGSIAGMTSLAPAWHKQSTIYGTVTDDDGVSELKVATASEIAAPGFTWASKENLYANGAWTYSLTEGAETLYFYVKDSNLTEFVSNVNDITRSPKISDLATPPATFGYKGSGRLDTILYLKVDTKAPQNYGAYYRTTDPSALPKWGSVDPTNNGWKNIAEISSDKGIGGPGSRLYVLYVAFDANGINKTGANIATDVLPLGALSAQKESYVEVTETQRISGFIFNTEEQTIDGKKYLSGNASYSLSVVTTDNAGTSYTSEYSISVDNAAPELSFVSHSDGSRIYAQQAGNVIIGRSNDAAEIYYTTSKSSTAPEAGSFTNVTDYVSTIGWTITYDGGVNVKNAGTYHDSVFATILDNLYGAGTSALDDLKDVYVWVFGKDTLGNASTPIAVRLSVDPAGDTPAIKITYPTADETLGGTIRVTGYTEMSTVTAATVQYVLMQIDPDYKGSFDEANWTTKLNTIINNANTYSPKKTSDEMAALLGWKVIDVNTISPTAALTVPKAISLEGTKFTSWGQNINTLEEFNNLADLAGSPEERTMAVRFYAVSNTNKISTPETVVFKINPNSPVYGEWILEDAQGNKRPYDSSNNWISGKWTLKGSVTHKSGISSVTVTDGGAGISFGTSAITDGFEISIPLGSSDSNAFGTHNIKVVSVDGSQQKKNAQASMTINYDNKVPVLSVSAPVADPVTLKAKVIQSNGSFTISGTVTEEGTGTASQSGFERVAVYFTRQLGTKTYVVNSMKLPGTISDPDPSAPGHNISSGTGQDNYVLVKTNSSITGGYSAGEGLYYKTAAITAVSGNEVTVDALPADLQLRSIVKIQGVFYLVTRINGSTVVLNKSVDSSSIGKNADFALAQIVDHEVTEGAATDYYGGISVTNDDGDYMGEKVEVKGETASWNAYINSLNIPDGDIVINVVAMDEAGNISTKSIAGEVINNRPRIAGVVFATDNDGSGVISDDEKIKFSNLYPFGKNEATGESVHELNLPLVGDSAIVTIKGLTEVYPEIVGGNVGVGYSYSFSAGGEKAYTDFASGTGIDNGHSTTHKKADYDSVRNGLVVRMDLLEMLQNNVEDGNGQTYTLKIWDKTEGRTAGSDSQFATISAKVNVAIKDSESAVSTIKPFYWNNASDNSSYFNSRVNGHIELEKDLPAANFKSTLTGVYDLDPKVSGVIKLEGSAEDNVQLSTLAVSLDGSTYMTFATRLNGVWNFEDLSAYGITYPQVDGQNAPISNEVFSNTDGHSVDWTLYYDSSKIGSPDNRVYAKTNVNFRIRAMDKGKAGLNAAKTAVVYTSNTPEAESNTATGVTKTNFYRMDIVPYITNVETTLSSAKKKNPTVYSRTALGHYPVYVLGKDSTINSGEVVKIYGYNLGSDYISVNSTAIGNSKAYSYTVNSISTLNNLNNNNAAGSYAGTISDSSTYSEKTTYAYNRLPNGDNNNLLTDDVYFDVWQINSAAAVPISGKIEQPVMKINPNNDKIGFAFVNGPLYFSMGGGTGSQNYSNIYWMGSYDFFTSVGFTYDKLGYSYGTAAGGDINSTSADKFQFMTSRWGKSSTAQNGSYGSTNSLRLESIGQKGDKAGNNTGTRNFDKQRIKSPSLATAVHGTGTNLYLAYYDAMNDELRFKYGSVAASKGNFGYFEDKETAGDPYTYAAGASSTVQLVAGNGVTRTAADGVTNANAGEYVSIGVVSAQGTTVDDVVVAVWYDAQNRIMWYSYNDTPTTVTNRKGDKTGAGWSAPVAVFEGTDYENAGEYCKLSVDGNGGIHIAAYDPVNLDLCYAYLPSAKGGKTVLSSDFTTCVVDSNGVVGSNLTIDTAISNGNAIPYIGYYATSCIRPKYATLAGSLADGSVDDEVTGSWEITVVPTPSSVEMQSNQHNDINIGVWKNKDTGVLKTTGIGTGASTTTNTPNAYSSTSYGQVFGNGTANPVLGYAVKSGTSSDTIETAQKR